MEKSAPKLILNERIYVEWDNTVPFCYRTELITIGWRLLSTPRGHPHSFSHDPLSSQKQNIEFFSCTESILHLLHLSARKKPLYFLRGFVIMLGSPG